ncbi:16S rRNA pseudouridine(516) synthase RsuA [Amphritea balenae]|uniref:Ribosomal small subunit pseudouridine synthase A n=1 Tax=Amphritea balenae TaxID=452629 RepID=A0A3P1SI45_9GAMM|nr:16S rRNA pseudouridine(516) synthase RsuA [Amphritea balenae]RRC96941.1 16S rRNA pseudouridine(516) synthase RsuA [Amphritea balenae]GGK85483.1 pseudouridine synthase [Amphritea balenae]
MRLDKYLSQVTGLPRSLTKRQIKCKNVEVNGEINQDQGYQVKAGDEVQLDGRILAPPGPKYLMLNKPEGTVCATEDPEHPTVIDLLDLENIKGLHPAGRLDIDTTGMVLITDDGQWSHRVTSPKHQCDKVYLVTTAEPVSEDYIAQFAQGIELRNEDKPTLPAELEILSENSARVTLHEGRYHQVKRMFAAVGNKVIGLHREQVGAIALDEQLEPGEYRFLTEQEVTSFK